MARSVGRRTVKAKKPVAPKKNVGRKREPSLFDFDDDFGNFDDDFGNFDDDFERDISPARTTRDLTTVAIAVPIMGIGLAGISNL